MKPKYKLGERVLFTDMDGLENLATITRVVIEETSNGMSIAYESNDMGFSDSDILGRVTIQTPRVRKKKENSNIQDGSADQESAPITDSINVNGDVT